MSGRLFISLLIALITISVSCKTGDGDSSFESASGDTLTLKTGDWRFAIKLDSKEIPFNAKLKNVDGVPSFTFINADESISSQGVRIVDDSITIDLPYFDSSIKGRIDSPTLITGCWVKPTTGDCVTLIAEHGNKYRFGPHHNHDEIKKKYDVEFSDDDGSYQAIGQFNSTEDELTGTFLTPTGDYRYLQGAIMNNRINLSTFDGAHAYLFTAEIKGDSLIDGQFLSAPTYSSSWKGVSKNPVTLPDPFSVTTMKEEYDGFDFSLPNNYGDTVSWSDLSFDGNVVIVDIMGTWCPNCLDASRYYKKLHDKYSQEGLRILPIAFELSDNLQSNIDRVDNYHNQLGIEYDYLIGGKATKSNASSKFPMLTPIEAFPTTLFIDKKGDVRAIHSGFSGPGTGKAFDAYKTRVDSIVTRLLDESVGV